MLFARVLWWTLARSSRWPRPHVRMAVASSTWSWAHLSWRSRRRETAASNRNRPTTFRRTPRFLAAGSSSLSSTRSVPVAQWRQHGARPGHVHGPRRGRGARGRQLALARRERRDAPQLGRRARPSSPGGSSGARSRRGHAHCARRLQSPHARVPAGRLRSARPLDGGPQERARPWARRLCDRRRVRRAALLRALSARSSPREPSGDGGTPRQLAGTRANSVARRPVRSHSRAAASRGGASGSG